MVSSSRVINGSLAVASLTSFQVTDEINSELGAELEHTSAGI